MCRHLAVPRKSEGARMVNKKVIIGGFAIGAAAGTALFTSSATPPPSDTASDYASVPSVPSPVQYSPNPRPAPPQSDFDRMVEEVARQQGGQISLRQMMAIAQITGGPPGGIPITRESSRGGIRTEQVGSRDPYAALSDAAPSASRNTDFADGTSSMNRYFDRAPEIEGATAAPPNIGAVDIGSGEYMAPAGPGAYVNTRNGTLYAPAGPNGVVDTRTGEFIPVKR